MVKKISRSFMLGLIVFNRIRMYIIGDLPNWIISVLKSNVEPETGFNLFSKGGGE
jgi:hypothetical protein